MEVGRALASPGTTQEDVDSIEKELHLFGLPVEHHKKPDRVVIWPENWQAFKLFQQTQTQWVIAPMGGFVGLNYQSVIKVIGLYEKQKQEKIELFENIQAIEQGFLSGINKNASK